MTEGLPLEPMETKRLPGIAASVVVTGMLLGATAAGLVMPIERWVTQLGGLLGQQGLLGVAVYGLLLSDLRPYLCARCSALLYGRFSLGSVGHSAWLGRV